MKKRSVITVVILLVIALAAYYAYTKYDEKTPDLVNRKPDVATDITTMLAAFEKDTASAGKLYLDKLVEIRGNVKSIDSSGAVILGTEGNPSEIVIGLDRRHLEDYKKIRVGTEAVLQGVCSGYSRGGSDPEDMLADLGTTIQFRSAGVKSTNK